MLGSKEKLLDHYYTNDGTKINTLHENFEYSSKNFAKNVYLSEIVGEHIISKTYLEVSNLRTHLGSGLLKLGIKEVKI